MFGYYTVDVFKTFGETRPELAGDLFLTEVGSISAVFGSLRFVWSAALDKFSYKIVYGTLLVFQIIIASTMIFAARSKGMFTTWVCLCIWCEAGHFTIIPNVLKKIFGAQAASLYGIMLTYTGILSVIMIGLLASPLGTDYIWFFELTAAMSAISLIILLTVFNEDPFVPDIEVIKMKKEVKEMREE